MFISVVFFVVFCCLVCSWFVFLNILLFLLSLDRGKWCWNDSSTIFLYPGFPYESPRAVGNGLF